MRRHPLSTTIKFQKLHDEVQLPEYKTELAAGMDLHAWLPDGKIVPTGFQMEMDGGYQLLVMDTWLGPSVEAFRQEEKGLESSDPKAIDPQFESCHFTP